MLPTELFFLVSCVSGVSQVIFLKHQELPCSSKCHCESYPLRNQEWKSPHTMDPAAREQSMYITGLLSIHLCTSPLFSTEKNKHSSFFNQILQDCKPESFEDLTAVNFIIEHSICPTPLVIQWRK